MNVPTSKNALKTDFISQNFLSKRLKVDQNKLSLLTHVQYVTMVKLVVFQSVH